MIGFQHSRHVTNVPGALVRRFDKSPKPEQGGVVGSSDDGALGSPPSPADPVDSIDSSVRAWDSAQRLSPAYARGAFAPEGKIDRLSSQLRRSATRLLLARSSISAESLIALGEFFISLTLFNRHVTPASLKGGGQRQATV